MLKRPPYADFAHEAELTPTFGRLSLFKARLNKYWEIGRKRAGGGRVSF